MVQSTLQSGTGVDESDSCTVGDWFLLQFNRKEYFHCDHKLFGRVGNEPQERSLVLLAKCRLWPGLISYRNDVY